MSSDVLKHSLSKVLVEYYPLAGRLRTSVQDDRKLEVDCNGEGALFVEASMDATADEFLEVSRKPNKSWSRKLIYRVDALSFLDTPPLIVQVTNLHCGGMILCTAINHCLCDGIGTSQFLHAWAHVATKPNQDLPITPFHARHVLKSRNPHKITSNHPGYTINTPSASGSGHIDLINVLQSQPLVPTSFTFTASSTLHLKRQCTPSFKCTAFEVLASHVWRSWVRAMDLPPSLHIKLLFSVNFRKKLTPELPRGYYGNGFLLACAESTAEDLAVGNLHRTVNLVQQAKLSLTDDYVRSVVDLLEDKTVKADLSSSLVISQWAKMGLEDLDFGLGKPLHMGPGSSDIYCLFLPVIGDFDAVRVQLSVPGNVVEKFEYYMEECLDNNNTTEENGDANEHHNSVF